MRGNRSASGWNGSVSVRAAVMAILKKMGAARRRRPLGFSERTTRSSAGTAAGWPIQRSEHPLEAELRDYHVDPSVARAALGLMAKLGMDELGGAADDAGCLRHRW